MLFRSTATVSRAPAQRRGLVAPPSGARLVLPGTGFQDCRTLLERLVREPDDRLRLRGQGHADDPPYAAIEPADLLAYVRLHAVARVAHPVSFMRVRCLGLFNFGLTISNDAADGGLLVGVMHVVGKGG